MKSPARNETALRGAGSGDKNEISQRDLADHLQDLAAKPADRLDGEEWAEFQAEDHEVQEVPRDYAWFGDFDVVRGAF